MNNLPPNTLTIAAAATKLGIGSGTLFRELRERGILGTTNRPLEPYKASGEFTERPVSYPLRGYYIHKYHFQPLVTEKGMALLELIAQDIRHGHISAPPKPNNNSTPCSAEESHRRCTEILEFLESGQEPPSTAVRAA